MSDKFQDLRKRIAERKLGRPETEFDLPLVAADWNGKAVDFTFDGKTADTCKNLAELLQALHERHTIVLESTFESYDRHRVARDAFIRECIRLGHDLRTISSRVTGRMRVLRGLGGKTDKADAMAIFAHASHGGHLKKPVLSDEMGRDTQDRAAVCRAEAVIARYTGRTEEEAAEAEALLDAAGVNLRLFLGNGKVYSEVLLASLLRASRAATSRKDFEHITGLYEAGYPSKLRSDFFHWGFRNIGNRKDEVTLSKFRHACRNAYHLLKKI